MPAGKTPTRETLLNESVLAKFLRYVQVDSPSRADTGQVPSTPEQWDMARLLEAELKTLGLQDVAVSEHAIVTATVPGNTPGAPVIGLLAHYDTYPDTPGRGVKPIVHKAYAGGDIALPAGPVLSPHNQPLLRDVVGHDIVTSDGSTLLGADDKAGLADIMAAVCRLLREPSLPRGDLRLAFTPDEETGTGVLHFDVASFGAVAAYTLDGGEPGIINGETFNAQNVTITITGRSAHTGTARGNMINAVQLAAQFAASIPAHMRPETTSDRDGFIHVDQVNGNVEQVTLKCLLRDFTTAGLAAKRELVDSLAAQLTRAYPGAHVHVAEGVRYSNIAEALATQPRIMALARQAYRNCGMEPREVGVRGGTDGSRLSEMGLPTPNLFTGGRNYHSRTEWASVQWMEQAVDMIVELVGLWSKER